MFQPQSTPLAFHASPYQYCHATNAAQSYNHSHASQPQDQSPQGDAGYGMGMGRGAGLGGMMIADEDGGDTGLRMGRMGGMCNNGGNMSDYTLPPTSLAVGGAAGVGVGRGGGGSGPRAVAGAIAGVPTVAGVGSSTRMGLVMGQGHGDGMGRPLGSRLGTADGVNMDTDRSMELQSRSHQRPSTGGEAAGRSNMPLRSHSSSNINSTSEGDGSSRDTSNNTLELDEMEPHLALGLPGLGQDLHGGGLHRLHLLVALVLRAPATLLLLLLLLVQRHHNSYPYHNHPLPPPPPHPRLLLLLLLLIYPRHPLLPSPPRPLALPFPTPPQ
ncbi:Peptidase C65 Otubain [Colletotrichum higginsianum IMI 349063]|uniref:Peptidase C65 Otubain n=1 Tax=Colletotrichum higginsianum (strain IMI 349063) TaxID=759273 RepID=A0A1B7Y850_COLHI|nr:Peptidase C65 Otubain [Colletotrichum higginsianum IMI 349063]OBR08209.1 Peptidase C65 Otubain [Colletotrichum higginsianum IMI 349063]